MPRDRVDAVDRADGRERAPYFEAEVALHDVLGARDDLRNLKDELRLRGLRDILEVGDEVVLLGRQGDEQITAQDLADLMGTITYEVTCLVGGRVTRRFD